MKEWGQLFLTGGCVGSWGQLILTYQTRCQPAAVNPKIKERCKGKQTHRPGGGDYYHSIKDDCALFPDPNGGKPEAPRVSSSQELNRNTPASKSAGKTEHRHGITMTSGCRRMEKTEIKRRENKPWRPIVHLHVNECHLFFFFSLFFFSFKWDALRCVILSAPHKRHWATTGSGLLWFFWLSCIWTQLRWLRADFQPGAWH